MSRRRPAWDVERARADPVAFLRALRADPALGALAREAFPRAGARLAAYGTLRPGRPNHDQVRGLAGRWRSGRVRGWLRAEPADAPTFAWDPEGPAVPVDVLESDALPAAWPRLDAFEGSGYFRALVPIEIDADEIDGGELDGGGLTGRGHASGDVPLGRVLVATLYEGRAAAFGS